MKRFSLFFTIVLLLLTGCKSRTKYFKPTGIIDRTIELSGKNVWVSLNEKESIDGYTNINHSIFGGEIACNIQPLDGIDVKTFRVLPGTGYARDKKNVYYPLETVCSDYRDCGVCYFTEIIIAGADPATFHYLGKGYASDNYHAFFRGEQLDGADGKTFKLIDGPEYFYFAIDKDKVYMHSTVFSQADPSTFHFNKNDPRNKSAKPGDKLIIGDKHAEWEFEPPGQVCELTRQ